MADDLISKYIDRAAFSEDTKFAIDEIAKLEAAYKSLRDQKVNLQGSTGTKDIATNAAAATTSIKNLTGAIEAQTQTINKTVQANNQQTVSLQQNIKTINDYKTALAANSALQKQALKDVESGKIGADEYRQTITQLTESQLKYKQALADATKEAKLQTQLKFAAPGSNLEARTQNAQITRQRDNTSDPAKIAELNILLDRNNALIDANSDKLAKQKINIGNYGPSVKAALSILEEEIIKINNQLATTDKNSKAFDVLTKQATLLKSVAGGLDTTFTSTKTELRALQEAAKKVGTEFGITSDQFKKFSSEVGERKNELEDIQKAINYKSSDTKGLDAAVAGIQAITGAYGAYQAAVVLTGEDNEELQKSMQKLQAALTLVTSVQAIANALQSESALVQGALAAKSGLLALAEKAAALATGQSAVALGAQTVAAESATVAVSGLAAAETAAAGGGVEVAAGSTIAAGALEAEAVAAVGLEGGLTAVAVSEGAVATGAISMATAIAATGIGLLIVGIAIAVFKLVEAIKDWNAADASTQKANEALAGSLKDLIEATKVYDDLSRLSAQRQLKDLDNLIAKRKALGVSTLEGLALDKKSADAKAKLAADEVKANDITAESVRQKNIASLVAAGGVKAAEELRLKYIKETQANKDKNYEDNIKAQDANIKSLRETADAAKAAYDIDAAYFTNAEDTKQQADLLTNQTLKQNSDDRRKFILENARIEADIQTSKNNKILNSDRSTLEERLTALKDNLAQQRRVINAENNAVQKDPTVSGTDKLISAKKATADIAKANRESDIAIEKMNEDFRLRDLAAETEYNKSIFNDIAKTNDAILANDAITEKQRLEALRTYALAKKAVLDQDLNQTLSTANISSADIDRIKKEGFFEIANKKITDEELKKLIQAYNQSVIDLSRESADKRITITKDYYQKEEDVRTKALKDIQKSQDAQTEDKTDTYNNQVIALNESFAKGLIGTKKYDEARKKLDTDLQKDLLKIQLDGIEKSIQAQQDQLKKAREKLLDEQKALKAFTGPQTDDEKKQSADRLKIIDTELKANEDAVGQLTGLYSDYSKKRKELSDINHQTAKKDLADLLDALQSFQEKANQVFNIVAGALNANAVSQKNRLQDQANAIDKNTKAEIDAVNASLASEQDKAAKIIIINARAQSQKDAIALKQKKIDEDQAKAQKAFAIFNIILSTAQAVIKAYTEGDPYTKVARAILAGAIGAAELAVAIATPVPKFKTGKYSDYEGPAIVGDGGVPEYVEHADGSIAKTPAHDTLTWLNKTDIVHPDLMSMMRRYAMPAIGLPPDTRSDNTENLERIIQNQTSTLSPLLKQIANKKELQIGADSGGMTAIHRWGSRQVSYVDQNTNW